MTRYSPALLGTANPGGTITPSFPVPASRVPTFTPCLNNNTKDLVQKTVNSGDLLSSVGNDAVNTDWMDCKIYACVNIQMERRVGDYYVLFWANGDTIPTNANESIYVEFMDEIFNTDGTSITQTHMVHARWLCAMLVSPNNTARASILFKKLPTAVKIGGDVAAGANFNSLYTVLSDPVTGNVIGTTSVPGSGMFTTLVDNKGHPLTTTISVATAKPILNVGIADNSGNTIGSTKSRPLFYRPLSADACHNIIMTIDTYGWNNKKVPLDRYYRFSAGKGVVNGSNALTNPHTFQTSTDGTNWTSGGDINTFKPGFVLTTADTPVTFVVSIVTTGEPYLALNRDFTPVDEAVFQFANQLPLLHINQDVIPDLTASTNIHLLSLTTPRSLISTTDISTHITNFIAANTYPVAQELSTELVSLATFPEATDKASIIMFGDDFTLSTPALNYIKNNSINTYVINYGPQTAPSSVIKSVSPVADKSLQNIRLTSTTIGAPEYRTIDSSLTATLGRSAYVGRTALMGALKNTNGIPVASFIPDISLNGVCMAYSLLDNCGILIGSSKSLQGANPLDTSNSLHVTLYDTSVISTTNTLTIAESSFEPGQRYIADVRLSNNLTPVFNNSLLIGKYKSYFVRSINLVNETNKTVWVKIYDIYPAGTILGIPLMDQHVKFNIMVGSHSTRDIKFQHPVQFLYGMYALASDNYEYTTESTSSISEVYLTVMYNPKDHTHSSVVIAPIPTVPIPGPTTTPGTNIASFSVDIVNSPSYLLSGIILYDRAKQNIKCILTSASGEDIPDDPSVSINFTTYIVRPGINIQNAVVNIYVNEDYLPGYPAIPDIPISSNINTALNEYQNLTAGECIFYTDIKITYHIPYYIFKDCRIWGTIGGPTTNGGSVKYAWASESPRGGIIQVESSTLYFTTETKKRSVYNSITRSYSNLSYRSITFVTTDTTAPLMATSNVIAQIDYYGANATKPETFSVPLGETFTDSSMVRIITSPDVSFDEQSIKIISQKGSVVTDLSFSNISSFKIINDIYNGIPYTIPYIRDLTGYFGGLPASHASRIGAADAYGKRQLTDAGDRMFTFSTPDMRGNIYFFSPTDTSAYYFTTAKANATVQGLRVYDASRNWDNIAHTNGTSNGWNQNTIKLKNVSFLTVSGSWSSPRDLKTDDTNTASRYPTLIPFSKDADISAWTEDPGWTSMSFQYLMPAAGNIQLPINNIKSNIMVSATGTTTLPATSYVGNLPSLSLNTGITTITVSGDFKKLGTFTTKPAGLEYLKNVLDVNHNITDLTGAFENATLLNLIVQKTAFQGQIPTVASPSWPSGITSLNSTFKGASQLVGIVNNLDTSNVTDMTSVLQGTNLEAYTNLSTWNVAKVKTMNSAFKGMPRFVGVGLNTWTTPSLEDLSETFMGSGEFRGDLTGWNVSRVKSLLNTFNGCGSFVGGGVSYWTTPSLETLEATFFGTKLGQDPMTDLSGWYVSKVKSMRYTFGYCPHLNGVKGLDKWYTPSLETLEGTFNKSSISTLDLSGWNVSRVRSMLNTFSECSQFVGNGLSNWSTASLETLERAFYGSTMLEDVDLSGWNVSRVKTLSNCFYICGKFIGKGLSQWRTPSLESLEAAFQQTNLSDVDLSGWDTSNVVSMYSAFSGSRFQGKGIQTWRTPKLTNMKYAFTQADLTDVDLSGWDISGVTGQGLEATFGLCSRFQGNGLQNWTAPFITTLENTFINCASLNTDFSKFKAANVTNMYNTFYGCASLQGTGFDQWQISFITTLYQTFNGCASFNGNLGGWQVYPTISMQDTFNGCKSFQGLGLNLWAPVSTNNMTRIFKDCESLNIDLPWEVYSVNSIQAGFQNCLSFDGDLSTWGVMRARDLTDLFNGCKKFTGKGLNGWNRNYGLNPQLHTLLVMTRTFKGCVSFNQNLSSWDVSHVQNMSDLFNGATSLQGTWLSSWRPSVALTDLSGTFNECTNFNADLSMWTVSGVTSMSGLFNGATSFTGNGLHYWKTPSLKDLTSAFAGTAITAARGSTSDLSGWDVSMVRSLNGTFKDCTQLIGGPAVLNAWHTPSLEDMSGTFSGCVSFNADLATWNFSRVKTLNSAFKNCESFVGGGLELLYTPSLEDLASTFMGCKSLLISAIQNWNVSRVRSMNSTFIGTTITTTGVNTWVTPSLEDMSGTFAGCTNFNNSLATWDVSNVSTMNSAFAGCTQFTGMGLSAWRPSKVTSLAYSFSGCTLFNADISSWNMSNVTDMTNTFSGNEPPNANNAFNRNLGSWNVSKVKSLNETFKNCTAFTASGLDKWRTASLENMPYTFLRGNLTSTDFSMWDVNNVTNMEGAFMFCTGFTGKGLDKWKTSSLTNIKKTFKNTQLANVDLSGWDVSGVTSLEETFALSPGYSGQGLSRWNISNKLTSMTDCFIYCVSLDGDLSNWDVTKVTNMDGTFTFCSAFTGKGLNTWNPLSVTSCNQMFQLCSKFNADISGWTPLRMNNCYSMFDGCTSFNSNLSKWYTPSLETMFKMFTDCRSFDSDISGWRPHNLKTVSRAFENCVSFNGNISGWDVSGVESMESMFKGCTKFQGKGLDTWQPIRIYTLNNTFQSCPAFIADISSWNSPTFMDYAFNGCASFNCNITNWSPGSMIRAFEGCTTFNGSLSGWNVSNISDFSYLFNGCRNLSGTGLSTWNLNATNMSNMFNSCANLNTDLSGWNVSNVSDFSYLFNGCTNLSGTGLSTWNPTAATNMSNMFNSCANLNTDLSGWNVSNVSNMSNMFNSCTKFNADISSWNVSKVTNMDGTFAGCNLFKPDLSKWRPKLTSMREIFMNCSSFNSNLAGWDVSAVTDMSGLFAFCSTFDGFGLDSWNVKSLTNFTNAFNGCTAFRSFFPNTNIRLWNVSNVTIMNGTFTGCILFSGDLSLWRPKPISMRETFMNCTSFNNNLSGWDVSALTDMSGTFANCTAFSGVGIDAWNIRSMTNLTNTFKGCTSFNPDLSTWTVSGVTSMAGTFNGANLFEGTGLNNWRTPSLNNIKETFQGCPSFNADLSGWTVSGVISMNSTFNGASSFKGTGLNNWKTPALTDLSGAFTNCVGFNADLSGWTVSKVTSMNDTFKGARLFQGTGLNNWRTPVLNNMAGIFNGCSSFNADLSMWTVSGVTSMSNAFNGANIFQGTGLNNWRTTQALTDLAGTFKGCTSFDACLTRWSVSGVTTMNSIFNGATAFRGSGLSNWRTPALTDLSGAFTGCVSFTGSGTSSLTSWNFSKVKSLNSTFKGSGFGGSGMNTWNTPSLEDLTEAFADCSGSFQFQNMTVNRVKSLRGTFKNVTTPFFLLPWTTSSVEDMSEMFAGSNINQYANSPFNVFDLPNVITMKGIFNNCRWLLPGGLAEIPNWTPTTKLRDLEAAFLGAGTALTIDINNPLHKIDLFYWDISEVTTLKNTFASPLIPINLSNWNTSNVTTLEGTFAGSLYHNQDLNWNTSKVTTLNTTFLNNTIFNGSLATWDVSSVVDMSAIFQGCAAFTGIGLNNWNTRSATTLAYSFSGCTLFNADISSWNVSNVTDMTNTFMGCTPFNRNLGRWNVSKVKSLNNTFNKCKAFTGIDIDKWQTSSLENMAYAFNDTKLSSNNTDLSMWDVKNVTNMEGAFMFCPLFGGIGLDRWKTYSLTNLKTTFNNSNLTTIDLSGWDVSGVTSLEETFMQNFEYTGIGLSSWNVSKVTNLRKCFWFDFQFDGDLSNWDVTKVTDMNGTFFQNISFTGKGLNTWNPLSMTTGSQTFHLCTNFNADISGWATPLMRSGFNMFNGCSNFKANLSKWYTPSLEDMNSMFVNCSSFDSDISGWRPHNLQNLSNAFENCVSFNGNISGWDVKGVVSMSSMFKGCTKFQGKGLDTWRPNSSVPPILVDMNNAFQSCPAFIADISSWNTPAYMTFAFKGCVSFNCNITNWSPFAVESAFEGCTTFNGSLSGWNISMVTNLRNLFNGCTNLSGMGLSTWNPINVTNMSNTFNGCTNFNADISSWIVSNVADMSGTFSGCNLFNRDLSKWRPKPTSMRGTFNNCYSFNSDLSGWNISNLQSASSGGMTNAFYRTSLSSPKFCSMLKGWALSGAGTVKPDASIPPNINMGNLSRIDLSVPATPTDGNKVYIPVNKLTTGPNAGTYLDSDISLAYHRLVGRGWIIDANLSEDFNGETY